MNKRNIPRLALECALSALALGALEALLASWLGRRVGYAAALCAGLGLAALFAVWRVQRLRRMVLEPLDTLWEMLSRHVKTEKDDMASVRQASPQTLINIAERLTAQMEQRIAHARQTAAVEAELGAQRLMAEEICGKALPQVLPDIPSRANFEVGGLVERGTAQDCQFYDYFYIDPGLLCVVLAQTPGGGVAEAMYIVVAQTTIRSRLRQGRSLEETMADVNAQLYDLGSRQCLNALVGTLGTSDGRFTYVNAGQQLPLLMRNEDRYEWLESPVYAPLGMNENVSYRSMELRLKQGDRIFLHTAGLAGLKARDGQAYGSRQLRADLNTSRGKGLESERLLRQISDNALAYSDDLHENPGYALLTLLFCKGDKELAHCDVPASPEYATEVTAFLKKQFSDNGIDPRHYAREAVLVDELFALCCRKAAEGSNIMLECGVAPDAQMVNIRLTAVLGGIDPLEDDVPPFAEKAVSFIQEHTDYVTFKPGEERDTITMVCFLGTL